MKRAKAYDKETGQFVEIKHAASLTEAMRYAYDYKCPENGCECTVHWRKEVRVKENTQTEPPTFVKNRSSSHVSGCRQDYERIVRENEEYTYLKNGAFHVRINFPMGTNNRDIFPMRGYLTEQQSDAANNRKNIQPFSSMKKLVAFIEDKLGRLDSDDLPDVFLHYQGHEALLSEKLIGNLNYDKLYALGIEHCQTDKGRAALTIVRPTHEIAENDKGKRRFVCEPQKIKIDGRKHAIKPVIVCFDNEGDIASMIARHIAKGETLMVATRPYSPGRRFGTPETTVSLNVRYPSQITKIASDYWRVIVPPQLSLPLPMQELQPG